MRQQLKFTLCSFCITILLLPADAQNLSTNIKVQAMDLATAWIKNDFDGFARHIQPEVIALAGGKEKLKATMDSAYVAMKRFSVTVKRYWIGSPDEIVHYKKQLQSVLPVSITLEMLLGEMTMENSMIVLSDDGGKSWKFIDTNLFTPEQLKENHIDISPDLVVPPRRKPKIVPKKSE